ncbi:MAG: formyltransferase family protein [Saprospiraceae bacterium]
MPNLLFFGANPISLQTAVFAREQGFECVIMADLDQCKKMEIAARQAEIELIAADKPEGLPIEQWIKNDRPTLPISIGAPWFFSPDFLEKRMGGLLLNLHGTHLPRSRGGTMFSWQILSGQRTGICLLHQMTERLDAGPVIDHEEFIYPAYCRKPIDFIHYYEEKNLAFLKRFLPNWVNNVFKMPLEAQSEYLSTYWPRLRAELHGWLDWNWPFIELERFICAFDEPYGGARCRWRAQEIIVRDAWAQSLDGHTHPFQWGLVTRNNGQWLNVAAQGGEILICSVQDSNGRDLLPLIKPGDRLYSSPGDLENALHRVVKTNKGLEIQSNKP